MNENSHLEALGMKKIPTETTAFGKVNETDKVNEVTLAKKKIKHAEASAAPDKTKKDAADLKKTVPAEEQELRTEQNAENVPPSFYEE